MTEKYISSQGLLIQSVHWLLLIRLQAKKPYLEILLMRTIYYQIPLIANKYLPLNARGLWMYDFFQAVVSSMNYYKQKSIGHMPRNVISFKIE